ncbi:MAG: hypothetical protein A2Y60_03215, partial [Chloroflexi bacterium RBG_13_54_9]
DHSLLIRVTRNCPWNRCLFCNTYKAVKFQYRSVEEVKEDIAAARALAEELKATSWRLGLAGSINGAVVEAMVNGSPELYDRDSVDVDVLELRLQSLVNVTNWLASGGRTVFLQDANTLIMRTPELLEVIKYLKASLPSIERVTSYARAKTAAQRTLAELKGLHEAGLSRLHIGLESGADEVLEYMQKGVTTEQHIRGGRKVVESGISLSEYMMPGLGGRRWSRRHALESARVLNEIDPDFIRLRSLVVSRGSPLSERLEGGDFQVLDEDEVVAEIGLFIESLNCRSYLASDQMANLLWEVEGQLPQDKQAMLDTITQYLSNSPLERLKFRLERRLSSYVSVYGGLSAEMKARVETAVYALQREAPDAQAKAEASIAILKQGFV